MARTTDVLQRRALVFVAGSQLLVLSLWFSASAVAPQLQSVWALSTVETAGLTVAVQVGFVVGAVVYAALGIPDMVRARTLFVASTLVGVVSNTLLLVVPVGGSAFALALRVVTGIALAGVYPSGLKVMSGWFAASRGMALGVLVGALTVGSAAPHLIKGFGADWQGVVLGASVLALAGALIMAWLVSDGPHDTPSQSFSWRHLGRLARNRAFRLSTLGYMGHMWELYAMWTWTGAYLAASASAAGTTDEWVGVATFVIIAAGGIGAWLAGVWADRFGRARLVRGALVVSGSCAVVTPLVFGAPLYIVLPVFLVWGIAVIADSAQFSAMVADTTEGHSRGTALTLQLASGFLLTLVTIHGVSWLADLWGWRWAFVCLAVGPIVGVAAMARLERHGAHVAAHLQPAMRH